MSLPSPIERLTDHNYAQWRTDVKFLLLEKNCLDIVLGTEKEPVVVAVDGKSAVTLKEVNEFKVRKRQALSILYLNVSQNFRRLVQDETEPEIIWNKLESHFRPDNRSRHMFLVSELFDCKIEKNESVDIFASRLKGISNQLSDIKQPMDEIYLSFQLLRYLPEKFDSIVQTILRWPKETFLFNKIVEELVSEESRLKLRDIDRKRVTDIEVNLVKSKVKCYRCGKVGHFRKNCRVKLTGSSYRNRSVSPQANFSGKSNSNKETPTRYQKNSRDNSRERNSYAPSKTENKSYEKGDSSRKSKFKQSYVCFIAESLYSSNCDYDKWVFDTAASHHFCKERNLFKDFEELSDQSMMVAIEGITFPVEGRGTVEITIGGREFCLTNVLYSPKLKRNLISGSILDSKGFSFRGGGGKVNIYKDQQFLFYGKLKNGIYFVNVDTPYSCSNTEAKTNRSKQNESLISWHSKFAHANTDAIIKTSRSHAVRGLPVFKFSKFDCESCKISKHRKVSFKPRSATRTTRPLELVYVDLWGPTQQTGVNNERYYLSVTDDFSGKMSVYPIVEKSEAFDIFRRHVLRAERSLDLKLKAVRSDNGGEFFNHKFKEYCNETGVQHEFTNPYSPQQNGTAERLNLTVVNGARAVLHESGMEKKFWPEAINYFVYSWNRLCHSGKQKTPHQLYTGKIPSVRHLKAFGSKVYVGIPKQTIGKLDDRAKIGILVGYAYRTKGYRIWIPGEEKIIETIDVSFPVAEQKGTGGAVLGQESTEDRDTGVEEVKGYIPQNDEPDSSSDEENVVEEEIPQLKEVQWFRKPVQRPDKSRTDIYYFEEGKSERLRSLNDVKKYCSRHGIKFESSIFSFKGEDTTTGIVNPMPSTSAIQPKHL